MKNLEDVVRNLVQYKNEKEWFEFKANWFNLDEIGEYISALSSSAALEGEKYGYLIWGVDDKSHEIVGTEFDQDMEINNEPIKHYLARNCNPYINFKFDNVKIDGKRVVVLSIPAAETLPVAFKNERYIRIGSSKEKLKKYPQKEPLIFKVLDSGKPTIVNTPSQYQDLSFEKILFYYKSKGIILNEETFRKNLGLLTDDGRYNIMAQLLSDDSHFPIRVAVFAGKTKADRLFSVKEFGYQFLFFSLEAILNYGDAVNIPLADEKHRVMERKEIPLFDTAVFREAVINAFIHNDWVSGNEPMFTMYTDRFEILSRGTLPPGQSMEGFFRGESVPVNERLSEIGIQLHISEKTGRGVPLIVSKYGREAYEFRENSIAVTIPFAHVDYDEEPAKHAISNPAGLTKIQEKILNEIRNNPNATIAQLSKLVGVGGTTIVKGLSELKNEGILERVGAKKNGYWKVRD